jgi:hypothetical protein
MPRTVNLSRCGEKTILIKRAKTDADVSNYDEINFAEVIHMDLFIETYHNTYADDLEEWIGIGNDKLQSTLGVAMLLNPMFGLKPKITGASLMADVKYDNARKDLICQVQNILDEKSPPMYSSGDDSDIDSDDGEMPQS